MDQTGRIPKACELLDLPCLHLVQSAVNSKIDMTYLRANLHKKYKHKMFLWIDAGYHKYRPLTIRQFTKVRKENILFVSNIFADNCGNPAKIFIAGNWVFALSLY